MSTDKSVKVGKDIVVSMEYKLTVDDKVIDSSDDGNPIVFLQGFRNIIPGLEKEIDGLAVGDKKFVVVAPEDGYGEYDEDNIKDIPRSDIPDKIPVEEGIDIEMRDADGFMLLGKIISFTDDMVKINFNHPLAGNDLHFDVKIVDLRPATEEELTHGHVHGPGGAH